MHYLRNRQTTKASHERLETMYYDYTVATDRISQLQQEADTARVAQRLASARRWARLASWAEHQARRASNHLS
jgi:hypothetical protein